MYNQDGVAINSEDFNRLMQRAGTRLVLQETIKQHNIECVVDNAYEILEKEENCSEEPVEQGWINRFFDSVADVSDEDLQKLWGKLLAGEIRQPKSYSLRTLETLKNLSKYEATLFQKIAPYIIKCYGNDSKTFYDYFLLSGLLTDSTAISKIQIDFSVILDLSNAGLISVDNFINAGVDISPHEAEVVYGTCKNIMLFNGGQNTAKIRAGAFILTTAGRELLPIVLSTSQIKPYETYMNDCWNLILKESMDAKDVKVEFYTIEESV